jgi:hypothetical protein
MMSKFRQLLFCVFVFDAALAPAALGCSADPFGALHGPAYVADFKKPDPLWPVDGKVAYFVDGQLAVKPDANQAAWSTIDSFRFNGAAICATVKTPTDSELPSGSAGGLVFGKADSANYYVAMLFANGTWQLSQRIDNSWKTIDRGNTSPQKFNRGPGGVNEIKVRLRPRTYATTTLLDMAFSINDDIVRQPDVAPVLGGGGFGVTVWSGADKASEWRFLDVTAAALSNPAGKYKVTGTYPGGASYSGTVSVSLDNYARGGERYDVGWEINGQQKVWGRGVANGEVFSVTFPNGGGTGIAAYTASATGWKGRRTNPAEEARIATETWVRQPP